MNQIEIHDIKTAVVINIVQSDNSIIIFLVPPLLCTQFLSDFILSEKQNETYFFTHEQ